MSETLPTLAPTVDATGIHLPTYPELLSFLEAEMRTIFGSDIYLDADSQDQQILAIVSKAWDDTNALAQAVYSAFSPASAQGVGLSSAVKINGIARLVPTRSAVDLVIIGQAGTVITGGAAEGEDGTRWNLPAAVTVPVSGEITVTAFAAQPGALRADADTIIRILTPTRGWQTVNNPTAAQPGAPVESDALLRIRQATSTALPSQTILDGMLGAIAAIEGVSRYKAYENDEGGEDANGIPGHTLSFVIDGGDVQTIVNTIGLKKSPGVGTYGTTSGTYTDFYGIPHTVNFYRPTDVPIEVEITIDALPNYTSVIGTSIRQAVVDYINGLAIGETIYWSKLFVPANLENVLPQGATFDIQTLQLSRDGDPVTSGDVTILFNEAATCVLDDVSLIVV